MQTIDISNILVREGRQRSNISSTSLEEFADKLAIHGLLHAIVLEADGKTLVAGERRLSAVRIMQEREQPLRHNGELVPFGHIPYTRIDQLSPEAVFELELEENLSRVDLSMPDKCRAIARLYELKNAKHLQQENAPLSVKAFAQDVTGEPDSQAFILPATNALLIAKHLDDPNVAKAKTQKEALNIIKRKQGDILRQALSQRLNAEGLSAAPKSRHTLYNASAFDILPTLPAASFDLIITDPPYGIDIDTMSTQSGSASGHVHTYSDDFEYASACVKLLAISGFQRLKASGACYMFCDIKFFKDWAEIFEREGWYVWPVPIIWDKSPTGSLLGAANGPRHVYETILYAIKGRHPVVSVGTDVIKIPGPAADKKHPAEKPEALYSTLLSWSASPGDTVLDPFCGSGNIFKAGTSRSCFVTGIEQDPVHYATANIALNAGELGI